MLEAAAERQTFDHRLFVSSETETSSTTISPSWLDSDKKKSETV